MMHIVLCNTRARAEPVSEWRPIECELKARPTLYGRKPWRERQEGREAPCPADTSVISTGDSHAPAALPLLLVSTEADD